LRKILQLYHTLKYLKWIQVRYRLFYFLKNKLPNQARKESLSESFFVTTIPLFHPFIHGEEMFIPPTGFRFLNQTKVFRDKIDWNFSEYGKLWTYNLAYFECVTQSELNSLDVEQKVLHFHDNYFSLKDALEPYPTSLRLINLIKFVSQHQLKNEKISELLSMDTSRLLRNIEYHLLGNHLLENAFALLFAGTYFSDHKLIDKTQKILTAELKEQVLDDGAHIELSPMYHQIILYRLLDSISLIRRNSDLWNESFLLCLEEKACKMLGWMNTMSFKNGQMPYVNDATAGIAPTSRELSDYAKKLSLTPKFDRFSSSGYRKFEGQNYELFMDVGNIGPDYIPGHAHSDTLNFIVHWNSKPFIVDTGITTYEKGEIRNKERSTSSHNTVLVNNKEQSAVWASFRVAERAYCTIHEQNEHETKASHDGYKKQGVVHTRHFMHKPNTLLILDKLNVKMGSKAYFHFDSDISLKYAENSFIGAFGKISFKGHSGLQIDYYQLSRGFNNSVEAQVITVDFNTQLETNVCFNQL
jgi:hypothetical protein